jgi:hypothetical protein
MTYARRKLLVLWLFIVLCVLGVVAFLLWGYFGEYKSRSWGYFLIIHVDCANDQPVIVARFASFRKEQSEGWVDSINRYSVAWVKNSDSWRTSIDSAMSDPFEGKPLKIENVCYSQTSLFGRTVHWSQNRFMAVYAEWADGRKVCKVVEIPDARISTEVRMQLP